MNTVRNLFGMACPNCASDEHLRVVVRVVARLSPDGTEPFGDHDWDDESLCMCDGCEFVGYVRQFVITEVAP